MCTIKESLYINATVGFGCYQTLSVDVSCIDEDKFFIFQMKVSSSRQFSGYVLLHTYKVHLCIRPLIYEVFCLHKTSFYCWSCFFTIFWLQYMCHSSNIKYSLNIMSHSLMYVANKWFKIRKLRCMALVQFTSVYPIL